MTQDRTAREVNWWEAAKPFPDLATLQTHVIKLKREIVPLVFLPGIMGSRLERAGAAFAWDPDDSVGMGWHYVARGKPKHRKELLVGGRFNPGFLTVMRALPKSARKAIEAATAPGVPTPAEAEQRGWGSVFWGSYGNFLLDLARHRPSFSAPGHDPINLAQIFSTPLYAVGYNWTASVRDAGTSVARRIQEIIQREAGNGPCNKALVITHSMGGLAGRAASELSSARSSIIGIVHGVQPVIGAAAAYWRMKAGFEHAVGESPEAMIKALGDSGKKVTAVLANIPGGLELLPSRQYKIKGKPWLRVYGPRQEVLLEVPGEDVFKEIYRTGAGFWRLVFEPELLDPMTDNPVAALRELERVLTIAEGLQGDLAGKMHPHTYAFHGDGMDHLTVNTIDLTFEPAAGYPRRPLKEVVADPSLRRVTDNDEYEGRDENEYVTFVRDKDQVVYRVSMRRADGPGDATVPTLSASILDARANKGMSMSPALNLEHQPAYDDGTAREFTRQAIALLLLRRAGERLGVLPP